MGQEAERDERLATLRDSRVNMALLEKARPLIEVMHCLHAQKAIMAAVIA